MKTYSTSQVLSYLSKKYVTFHGLSAQWKNVSFQYAITHVKQLLDNGSLLGSVIDQHSFYKSTYSQVIPWNKDGVTKLRDI